MTGTILGGRYELQSEIGRGGMGVVWLARDPLLDREVAIKLVAPHQLSDRSIERLRREAQIVARMEHPSIVCFLCSARSSLSELRRVFPANGASAGRWIARRFWNCWP